MFAKPHKAIPVLILLACVSCGGDLRGSVENSSDGKTYLLVAIGNNCEQVKVDGTVWSHAIGDAGEIAPGAHVIDCNGQIGFVIPARTVFKFNYWGP
jgi:hypothetical protein